MKVFIVLAAFVAVASAGRLGYGGPAYGAISTGSSSQFRSEDNYGNYNFGYDESHATGGTSRREEQANGVRRGSYSLNDADGRHRVVNYVADATGFHATVQTNEPGVEPKDPANVLINKAGYAVEAAPAYAAPVAAPVAPVAIAAPLPAPVAYGGAIKGAGYGPRYGPVAAPVAIAAPGPVYSEAPAYEATPRAFSYAFGATHVAPVAAPAYAAPAYAAPAPLPLPAPVAAPVYQQRAEY